MTTTTDRLRPLTLAWAVAAALVLLSSTGCEEEPAPTAAATEGQEAAPDEARASAGGEPARAKQPQPSAAAEQRASTAEGLFYRVEGKAGTAYLLGSVHVAKPDLYPLRAEIESAFDDADALALELQLDESSKAAMAQKLMSSARYPEGETLQDHLEPKTLELYREHKDQAGPMAAVLHQFKPWFVAMTLAQMVLQQHGYSPQHGIDMHFQQQVGDKEQLALETVDDQLAIFTSLDDETQDLMLRETLEELDQIDERTDEIFAAWKAGDAEKMEALVLEMKSDERYEPVYEALIVRRNERMAERIRELLEEEGTTFVVVGSAHVIGDEGIVARLEQAGYEVDEL